MKKISADWLFSIASAPIKEGVLITDEVGKILAVETREQHDPSSLQILPGVLTPGFVNTHCHLELSHMKAKVDTGTGLIPFISGVVTRRAASADSIAAAIEAAEAEMLAGGIVALGDISNTTDTFAVKAKGRMRYHTFVEMFDFLQDDKADSTFEKYKAVFDALLLAPGSQKTSVPHAPYSVSRRLFQKLRTENPASGASISIHNQETLAENKLFLRKQGDFLGFYEKFGVSLHKFRATKKPSIHYALENMNPANRTLFVHNTLSTKEDIEAAQAWSPNVFWATCPNANLYIENRLPNYQVFLDAKARMSIGTDSLTSNWQLSILEEMKTIARYQSYVPFETILQWATLNGAQALGFDDTLGSLEVGKTPGVLCLTGLLPTGQLGQDAAVQRII